MSKSLTLGKLSEYDDFLTDLLIDKVYFWTRTRKADRHHKHCDRPVETQEIVDILQKHVIPYQGKLGNAVEAFRNLKVALPFYRGLSKAQKSDFEKHLRKYLSIYQVQAGFEICTNKPWKLGEVVQCLTGTIVAMTSEEEDFYEAGHDFSILHSSRLDSMCLFLGPARFVNHDCSPNGAFVTQGGFIAIAIIRPVSIGEEITVYYSDNYFGPDNADCLCATCERKGARGYRFKADRDATAEQNAHLRDEDDNSLADARAVNTDKKRNQVQTIEITKNGQEKASVATTSAHIATPPDSELSIDDIAKSYNQFTDDEIVFQSDDENDADFVASETGRDEEGEIVVDELGLESDPKDGDTEETHSDDEEFEQQCNMLYGTHVILISDESDQESDSDNDSETTTELKPAKKILRPRRAVQDYNLKRQSLASLHPVSDDEVRRRRRSNRKADADYCSVCEDEMSHFSSNNASRAQHKFTDSKTAICKRCERHAKIYSSPWPIRTAKPTSSQIWKLSKVSTVSRSDSLMSSSSGTSSRSAVQKGITQPAATDTPPSRPVRFTTSGHTAASAEANDQKSGKSLKQQCLTFQKQCIEELNLPVADRQRFYTALKDKDPSDEARSSNILQDVNGRSAPGLETSQTGGKHNESANKRRSQHKTRSAGSWYYVDIDSDDSDHQPKILVGRTRREERELGFKSPKRKSPRKVYALQTPETRRMPRWFGSEAKVPS